jgi:superfamily II DNA or RNA helicase
LSLPSSADPNPEWQPGDRILLRAREWTILERTVCDRCETLRLEPPSAGQPRTFLLPFDRPRRLDPDRIRVVSRRLWLRAFARRLALSFPYGGLRCFPESIELAPYQIEPALAVLRYGHPRLLVADAVGMGKTIEAALILVELAHAREGFRALLLTPAGLRGQWADELRSRFGLDAVLADNAWLQAAARLLPADVNPWSTPGIHIASLDFVKRAEALRSLEDVRWDLLIADEAHAAAPGTDRRAAIDAIGARALRVVLLTGTPPPDPHELLALSRIGEARGDGIIVFRRHRPRGSGRRSRILVPRLSEEERFLHDLLERYTSLVWQEAERRGDHRARLASIVLRKRALSSPAALDTTLRRRQALLGGMLPEPDLQMLLPLDDDEALDEGVQDEVLGRAGLDDLATEQDWIAKLIAAAAACGDSKARVLVKLLTRVRQPAIVFTEYRHTLEYLRTVLHGANVPAAALHGGLLAAERRDVLTDFARGRTVLLATDAAAEGLNLQQKCRIVIHYELPWNPLRLVQRAGRVDRIGQTRRVHEIALVRAHTAEALVLAPLVRRASAWTDARSAARMVSLLTESRVAEAVFGGSLPELKGSASPEGDLPTLDLRADAEAETLRLARRRLAAVPVASAFRRKARRTTRNGRLAGIPVTTLSRTTLASGLVLVFDLTCATQSGDVVERAPAIVHVSTGRIVFPWRPRELRLVLNELLPGVLTAVAPTLDDLQRRQLLAVRPRFHVSAGRLTRRAAAIADVHDSAARRLVQAGLFEWRPSRAAARAVRSTSLLERGADQPAPLTAHADLRAVLVVQHR